jgi:alpha-tubulin suppressor-like RCC1 family protein
MDHRSLRASVALVAAVAWALPHTAVAADTTPTTDVIAVSDHTCVVTTGGGVKCWGDNSSGGLGDGTTTASSTPVDVAGLASGVTAIAAGDRYSCALTSGGGVRCWGYNEFGQLGDGTNMDSATPVDVAGLASGVKAIDARGEHTCALMTAGGVKCWGANINGQLGDGTTASSGVPVDVAGLTSGGSAITVGGEHTCAITSRGGLKCWGWNAKGQVGIGTTTDSNSPVDVPGLAGAVSAVAAGGRHTCALMTAGGVSCWGYNEFGQLGDGTTSDSPMPVAVAGLPRSVRAITTGGNFSCALKTDGAVMCWGNNGAGQLGDGTYTDSPAPVEATGLASGVSAIAAGYYHICGITKDRGVTCWGGNDSGQLGIGTTGVESPTMTGVKNADGSPLIAASIDDSENSNPLPIAVAVLVGVVLILAAGGFWLARRRGH